MNQEVYDTAYVAKLWGITKAHVVKLIEAGRLPAINVGTNLNGNARYRITQAAIDAFMASGQPQAASEPVATKAKKAK